MSRNERFPSAFQFHIETLVQLLCQHIVQRHRESPTETRSANTSLANFVKVSDANCFCFLRHQFDCQFSWFICCNVWVLVLRLWLGVLWCVFSNASHSWIEVLFFVWWACTWRTSILQTERYAELFVLGFSWKLLSDNVSYACCYLVIVVVCSIFQMLYEFKFDFLRIICSHEHYIQLNLPMMRKQVKNFKGKLSALHCIWWHYTVTLQITCKRCKVITSKCYFSYHYC